jgi:hypothetical protein
MKIEIARSYGEKVSLGNYCMADFFCSAKCEVEESKDELKSNELYLFCLNQVKKDIEEYKEEIEINKILENKNDTKQSTNTKSVEVKIPQ